TDDCGRVLANKTKSRFDRPGTTMCLPRMVSVYAIRAAASAVIPALLLFSRMPARDRNSVCVMPGQKTVTVTPVSFSSFCNEDENESKNALHALYTDWNGTGE